MVHAALSLPLNIAEGNGKRSLKDRARFSDIARGSVLEGTAIQDGLVTTQGIKVQDDAAMKAMLHRVVVKFDGVAAYNAEIDYEHRCAEHEHEHEHEHDYGQECECECECECESQTYEGLEPWDVTKWRW